MNEDIIDTAVWMMIFGSGIIVLFTAIMEVFP